MGVWGYGLFENDYALDEVADLSDMAGVELSLVGWTEEDGDYEQKDPPIMSVEDTKAHLDNGNFNRVFNTLKEREEYYLLCLFVGKAMEVGTNIEPEQIDYLESVYRKVDNENMFNGFKQMELAFREYQSGESYKLKEFPDPEEAESEPVESMPPINAEAQVDTQSTVVGAKL